MGITRFVVVATSARGTLARPELLDDANQWRALKSAAEAPAEEPDSQLRLATRFVQAERDRELNAREMDSLTRGVETMAQRVVRQRRAS